VTAEAAAFHAVKFSSGAGRYRQQLHAALTSGMTVPAREYILALQHCRRVGRELAASMRGVDALLLPAAPATAPRSLETTGDGTYCAPWSYAGLPAITLPSGLSSEGLPLGIQLIGPPRQDEHLLCLAAWFERVLAFDGEPRNGS
jgi:Asp-tRNA(Asn)/Glu-tRNA(Gln) amidotransferase A subunit family amidase